MSRFTEKQLRSLAVTIIDEFGQINTSELLHELRERLRPDGEDLEILNNRADDRFSQKVRNLVSHLSSNSSIKKYVDVDKSVRPAVFTSKRYKESIALLNENERKKVLQKKIESARLFTGRFIQYESYQKEIAEIGNLGELFYLEIEKALVKAALGKAMAKEVIHSSKVEGDGTGYDILSFGINGIRHIEVKTTTYALETPFYMSINEWMFYKQHIDTYYLARVYEFDKKKKTGKYKLYHGSQIASLFDFQTQLYRVALTIAP